MEDGPKDISVIEEIVQTIPRAARDEVYSSLYAYLSRPIQVASGTWSDSDSALDFDYRNGKATSLTSLVFPDVLLEKSAGFICKLKDFALLRASVDLRIQFNATPMQSGRLFCMFSPYQSLVDFGSIIEPTYSLSGVTGYPGVEIDLASANSVVLSIPFCSFRESYNLVTGEGRFGEFNLFPLSPLRLGTVDYTIWASFRNIHLSVPSPISTILLSSSQYVNFLKQLLNERDLMRGDALSILEEVANMPEAQVLEKVVGAVSNVVDTIGSVVNTVTSAASAVVPIASSVLSTAAMFGFSKPSNESATVQTTSKPARSLQHVSASEDVTRLAADPMCSLGGNRDLFGTNSDEMALAFVLSRPNIVETFSMTVDDLEGVSLLDIPITPSYCHLVDGTAAKGLYASTHLSYISNLFAYWNGSLVYNIKLAKTSLHSARIRISYWPFTSSYDADLASNAYSLVMDLRESSEISFPVPYVSSLPWLKTNSYQHDVGTSGRLRISVVNALRNAGDTDSTIDGFVWISAGEDFKLAGYGFNDSAIRATPFSSFGEAPDPPMEVDELPVAQVGEKSIAASNLEQASSMQMLSADSDPEYAVYACIGEHISNLRSLLKRAVFYRRLDSPTTPFSLYHPLDPATTELPAVTDFDVEWRGAGQVGLPEVGQIHPINYLSRIYRFFRGAIRYHFFPTDNPGGFLKTYPRLQAAMNTPINVLPIAHNSVPQVEVPFMQMCSKRLVGFDIRPYASEFSKLSGVATGYTGHFEVFVNVGEDFSFGWLIGAPAVVSYSTPSSGEIVGSFSPVPIRIYGDSSTEYANVTDNSLNVVGA